MASNLQSLGSPTEARPLNPADALALPAPPPRQRMRWLRARRALRELLDDPDDTQKAIDLIFAIGSRNFESTFQRFAASYGGRQLLLERPSLGAALADRAHLESLAEDTFGRAYLAYIDANGFEPTALVELQHRVQARWEREEGTPSLDPTRSWFRDRLLLSHDIFHLLTGYGTDAVGEATLLAFSHAQLGGRAQALLTFGAAIEVCQHLGKSFLSYEWRAWKRGRKATWLIALPWEQLLERPHAEVCALVGVDPAAQSHPEGVIRGHFEEAGFVPSPQQGWEL